MVLRGKERIQAEVQLVDKLAPYQHPLAGHPAAADGGRSGRDGPLRLSAEPGRAGRDRRRRRAAETRRPGRRRPRRVAARMVALEAGQETEIEFRHDHKRRTVKVTLDRLPEGLPPADSAAGPSAQLQAGEPPRRPRSRPVVPLFGRPNSRTKSGPTCRSRTTPAVPHGAGGLAARPGGRKSQGTAGAVEAAVRPLRPDSRGPPRRRPDGLENGRSRAGRQPHPAGPSRTTTSTRRGWWSAARRAAARWPRCWRCATASSSRPRR